jgi:hypothetical protein
VGEKRVRVKRGPESRREGEATPVKISVDLGALKKIKKKKRIKYE